MPAKRYKGTKTQEERTYLVNLISKGKTAAQKLTKAHILLNADCSEKRTARSDQEISDTLNVSCATTPRVRKTFVEEGLDAALNRKKRELSGYQKFDGEKEAHLIALACSEPPPFDMRWTAKLLADKLVELNHFESLSFDPVRLVAKKNELKPWLKKQWCIPPNASCEFVCAISAILEVYQRPYFATYPLVCLDETSKQLIYRSSFANTLGTRKTFDL